MKINGSNYVMNGNRGRYEMIYADAHVKVSIGVGVSQCQLAVVCRVGTKRTVAARGQSGFLARTS